MINYKIISSVHFFFPQTLQVGNHTRKYVNEWRIGMFVVYRQRLVEVLEHLDECTLTVYKKKFCETLTKKKKILILIYKESSNLDLISTIYVLTSCSNFCKATKKSHNI